MDISSEIRARIITAADELWAQAQAEGSDRWPPVDVVRRAARANMNDVSAVMKDWRRMQTQVVAKVAVDVPESVREAAMRSAETAWQAAQDVAGEHLAAAQQQWDQERGDAETMRREISDAYDAAQAESEDLRTQIVQMQAVAEHAATEHVAEVRRMGDERQQVEVRASKAEQDAQHQRAIAERLEGEKQEQRDRLDAEKERRARAEQSAEDLRSEIAKMQTQNERLVKEHAEAVRRLEEVHTDLREKLDAATERAVRGEQRAEGLAAQVEQMAAGANRAEQQHRADVERLEGGQQALRMKLDEAIQQAARSEQRAEDLDAEVHRERERLDALLRAQGAQGKPQTKAGRQGGPEDEAGD